MQVTMPYAEVLAVRILEVEALELDDFPGEVMVSVNSSEPLRSSDLEEAMRECLPTDRMSDLWMRFDLEHPLAFIPDPENSEHDEGVVQWWTLGLRPRPASSAQVRRPNKRYPAPDFKPGDVLFLIGTGISGVVEPGPEPAVVGVFADGTRLTAQELLDAWSGKGPLGTRLGWSGAGRRRRVNR